MWNKSSSLLWLWSTMFSQCVRICMHDCVCVCVFKLNAVNFHISVHFHLNLHFLTARINMNAWISAVMLSLQRGIFLLPFVWLHKPTGKKRLINTRKLTELCCSWTRGFSCSLNLNRAATVTGGWRAPFHFFLKQMLMYKTLHCIIGTHRHVINLTYPQNKAKINIRRCFPHSSLRDLSDYC